MTKQKNTTAVADILLQLERQKMRKLTTKTNLYWEGLKCYACKKLITEYSSYFTIWTCDQYIRYLHISCLAKFIPDKWDKIPQTCDYCNKKKTQIYRNDAGNTFQYICRECAPIEANKLINGD